MTITIKNNWVFVEDDPKPKGRIINGMYVSHRYKKKEKGHFFRLGNGYPINTEILFWLDEHDISDILIIEKCMDGDRHYFSTVEKYLSENEFEFGFGKQRCVPLEKMKLLSKEELMEW